mmetsp:Transcript_69529/g.224958  ORF Transcript_69529/g.224958 Transcript_69529/m.224958 type:complete len:245 (-) Transcript_69529:234-968(-)
MTRPRTTMWSSSPAAPSSRSSSLGKTSRRTRVPSSVSIAASERPWKSSMREERVPARRQSAVLFLTVTLSKKRHSAGKLWSASTNLSRGISQTVQGVSAFSVALQPSSMPSRIVSPSHWPLESRLTTRPSTSICTQPRSTRSMQEPMVPSFTISCCAWKDLPTTICESWLTNSGQQLWKMGSCMSSCSSSSRSSGTAPMTLLRFGLLCSRFSSMTLSTADFHRSPGLPIAVFWLMRRSTPPRAP